LSILDIVWTFSPRAPDLPDFAMENPALDAGSGSIPAIGLPQLAEK
jgi:hypothetical protein